MLRIHGPVPSLSEQIILPSPLETNTEQLTSSVSTIRMMDGGLRTYVKRRSGRKRFRWEFNVGHWKAKEVEDFAIDHSGELSQVIWKDSVYLGYLTLNPLSMSGSQQEYYTIILEFEER